MTNSRIYNRTYINGDIRTETQNNPSGLFVDIESGRFGKEGTTMTIGFEDAPNRWTRLDGRQARTLFKALQRHFNGFIYND